MEQEYNHLEEENGYLCFSCLRFFAPSDVFQTWSTVVAMSANLSHGCRLITEGGGYICRNCIAESQQEMEEKERLLAARQEAARQRR